MMACGAYFLIKEQKYLDLLNDGDAASRPSLSSIGLLRSSLHAEGKEAGRVPATMLPAAREEPCLGLAAAAVGAVQGLCCPSAPTGAALALALPAVALGLCTVALLLAS